MTTTTSSTIDREPWTVDCRNVADHAMPLALWINRTLWDWSPWHLRYLRRLRERQAGNLRARNYMLETMLHDANEQVRKMVDAQLEPMRRALQDACDRPGFHADITEEPFGTRYTFRVAVPSLEYSVICGVPVVIHKDYLKEATNRMGYVAGNKLADEMRKAFIKAGVIEEEGEEAK